MRLWLGVVALFVDPRGPYPRIVREWYDAARDARTYAGDDPVVAHPPCGPWGALRHLSRKDDPELAIFAAGVVRRVGGVLEHPRGSRLFCRMGMPRPGELPDEHGGRTIEVQQCDWGHPARKRTWLYVVGPAILPPTPPTREPTHWVSGTRDRSSGRTTVPPGIKVCSAQQRNRTPEAFARWLVEVAASIRRAR